MDGRIVLGVEGHEVLAHAGRARWPGVMVLGGFRSHGWYGSRPPSRTARGREPFIVGSAVRRAPCWASKRT